MALSFATWNVNSVRVRLPHVLDFLATEQPDVLMLQEIKVETGKFPRLEIAGAGYEAVVHGQKSYNGVATLLRRGLAHDAVATPVFGGRDDARCLVLRAGGITFANCYFPNGNPPGSENFAFKLAWTRGFTGFVAPRIRAGEALVIAGDMNVCPEPRDCGVPGAEGADSTCMPQSRAAWRELLWQGFTDAARALDPHGNPWTYWDYRSGDWEADRGLRIDHALLSPDIAERLAGCRVAKRMRGLASPSDHAPLLCVLE
ncbi:MAG: exodeoxyribonuclease III [Acetobacteraceae bacterium]|nr:exodeoxyribonuclease III [Acetobacteraceae bacterium]